MADVQPFAEARYIEITDRFAKLTNSFLEKTKESGGEFLVDLPASINPDAAFRARSRLFYTYVLTLTGQNPIGWLFDLLRTRRQQIRALEWDVGEYLSTLLSINSTRIANDFDERILESRRCFEREIMDSFDNIISSSQDALNKAQAEIAKGSIAVKARVEELKGLFCVWRRYFNSTELCEAMQWRKLTIWRIPTVAREYVWSTSLAQRRDRSYAFPESPHLLSNGRI